jgi:hypothetical protein
LWAQQNLDMELAIGRSSATERAGRTRAYELMLANESLAAERARVEAALQDCPGGARQPWQLSAGDRVRDAIRLRLGDDLQAQAGVAQVALADWRVRRARATGEVRFCDEARQALTTSSGVAPPPGEALATDLLAGLGAATVTRDPARMADAQDSAAAVTVSPGATSAAATVGIVLSEYALGAVDTVRAPAPLPHYLAAVYGGVVVGGTPPPLKGLTPESIVDLAAPAYPQWEPDALFAALRPA